jgi:hypothetical protein
VVEGVILFKKHIRHGLEVQARVQVPDATLKLAGTVVPLIAEPDAGVNV